MVQAIKVNSSTYTDRLCKPLKYYHKLPGLQYIYISGIVYKWKGMAEKDNSQPPKANLNQKDVCYTYEWMNGAC